MRSGSTYSVSSDACIRRWLSALPLIQSSSTHPNVPRGIVVDIIEPRKYLWAGKVEHTPVHAHAFSLEGHSIDSGFEAEDNTAHLLLSLPATPIILAGGHTNHRNADRWRRACREEDGGTGRRLV